ncbi:putative ribonuclease H-like domain-containing protein [Tanacetum coccineum]
MLARGGFFKLRTSGPFGREYPTKDEPSNEEQHRASCKTKTVSSISQPLQMLHMDLFGPAFVKSLMKKMYSLVVTDDFSRFSWVFFLATKVETSKILTTFITGIENLIDLRVKVIRCDNGTEFKNRVMNQFCEMKGIKREFSVARTLQQNEVAERKNRTLIKAARTMLANSKLPTTLWAKVVNTACYVQNRVLVIKPHNKTPYELFLGRKHALSFMRPFGCPITILNTIDHLGKFDGKVDEGFFVGYSTNSKAFRVFNSRTRIVEENLHIQFSENTPNIAGSTKACDDAGKARVETISSKDYILLPLWIQVPPFSSSSKDSPDAEFKPSGEDEKKDAEDLGNEDSEVLSTEELRVNQEKDASVNSTNTINIVSPTVNVVGIKDNVVDENIVYGCDDDLNILELEEIVYLDDDEDVGAEADMTNLDTHIPVSPIPTTRIHKDHRVEQIIGDIHSAPKTRRMTKKEPKKVIQALKDPSWIEAMQEELLQFKLQQVWTLVDLPNGKRAIGTKWVYKNKKDERGIMIKDKARLVAQECTQEEGINYDKEVYVCQPPGFEDPDFPDKVYKVEKALYGLHQAPRAWYETLSTYLLDNRFQRGKIDKTLFIRRDKGDILLVQVYVDDIIFGSIKKSLCTEFEKMMHKKFQMSSIGELTFFPGLQVKQKEDGIFISQYKYVTEILKKFSFSDVKTASTPMETHKPLLKDTDGEDVDEHLYRSMIGSLMYLTSSRPDIMFAVCACARFQVNPKSSHLHAVKRVFRYLKCQPKLGLWYPKDSPFDLVAYTDSDYAEASLDRKFKKRKRIFEEAARQEDEKRIAIEKEAAELEAKRKSQECLNIEEKSIPQASIRSRKSRIDPTLSNFTVSTKRIPFSTVETVNSLKMGDKHLDTQKGSLESSVKDPIPIPSESDVIFDGDCDDDYKKRFDLKVQQLWMPSIYDENNKIRECYIIRPSAITPDLPIPDSLIMEDEHLDTIPVTESANTIKSSVEELVPTPSESADLSDDERECDVPVNDESSPTFATFSNPLFDSKDDFTSSDNESFSDEDFHICFNAESYLIESLLNRDTLIDSSPKFDYLLEEFSGELAHTDPIPPGVVDTDSEPEEEIRLAENLSYDNSSPRPPEERNSEIADTIVESLSPPPIPVEDKVDIRFLEELLSSDSPPLLENKSFSLDHFDDPSLPRPPPELPDVEFCFNFEPDAGDFINKVVPGTVAVRGGRHVSTRYCSDDGWTNPRVTRGTGVCQSERRTESKESKTATLGTMTSHEDLSPTICICDEEQAEPNHNGRRCGKHLPRRLNKPDKETTQ